MLNSLCFSIICEAKNMQSTQKHGLSSSLRKEAILGVVGTSSSDLFDHDMPLDNHFSFISILLWCALLFSVCGSNTMLKAQRDVRVNTFPERIALNVSCTVCYTTVGFCTTVQRMTPRVIAQQSYKITAVTSSAFILPCSQAHTLHNI